MFRLPTVAAFKPFRISSVTVSQSKTDAPYVRADEGQGVTAVLFCRDVGRETWLVTLPGRGVVRRNFRVFVGIVLRMLRT